MPTYSYRCTECAHEFDIRQSFNDAPLTVCDNCGGQLRKLFNSVGVVFKGSGFYRTDSKTPGSSQNKSSALTAEKSTQTSAEKPAETTTSANTSTSTDTSSK